MKVQLNCKHDSDNLAEIRAIVANHNGVIDEDLTKEDAVVIDFEHDSDGLRIAELFEQAGIVDSTQVLD